MKWVLIIYFFISGPNGGWTETDRTFYQTKQQCIEYKDFFNDLPKPGTLMARCKRADSVSK
jgi:hypothetical protein